MLVNSGLELENQFLYFVIAFRGQELGTQVTDSIFSSHRNVQQRIDPTMGRNDFVYSSYCIATLCTKFVSLRWKT